MLPDAHKTTLAVNAHRATALSSVRERATGHLKQLLVRDTFPRVEMALMLSLTGLVGFLASALLLHLGLDTMAIRYAVAVVVAYATFLLLVRGWTARHLYGRRSRIDPVDFVDVPTPEFQAVPEDHSDVFGGGSFGGGGAGGSFEAPEVAGSAASSIEVSSVAGDLVSGTGSSVAGDAIGSAADEAWPLVLVVAVLAGTVVGTFMALWAAPALLAEILLDAMIVGGMVRQLRRTDRPHWTLGVLGRTWIPAMSLLVLLAGSGWGMQAWVPQAQSIGDFVAAIRTN